MALTPVEMPRFGGLDLRTDPEDVGFGAAVDMLDVDRNVRGLLRSRDGYTKFSAAAATNRLGRLSAVSLRLFASDNTAGKTLAYYIDGTAITSAVIAGGPPANWVGFGTPASAITYAYGGTGTATNTIARFQEGVGFTYPAAGYSSVYVAVQPYDNRLVLVRESQSTSGGFRVRFSDAGLPETYTANSYVDLTPNDGDNITGTATYDNKIFVFKQTKFFVFYGNSVDGSGNPVFNYRMVDTGKGNLYSGACCASPDGVYFIGKDGVYLTTGGPPVKVSKALDGLFLGVVPSTYGGSSINWGALPQNYPTLAWFNDRLYFSVATGSSTTQDRLFVLDKDLGWLAWSVPVAGMTPWLAPTGSAFYDAMYFSYGSGTKDIGYLNPAATTDGGTAISAKWRSGFWNPGQPAGESVVREWLLDGVGTVGFKVATNDGSLGSSASIALGTSPAVAQGRDRRAVRGRNMSVEISGTGPWSVSRLVANVRGQRNAGLKAT